MKQTLITVFFNLLITSLFGQNSREFIIKSSSPNDIGVKVFGEISVPLNDYIPKVKIRTNEGKEKYTANEVSYFSADNVEFVSVPGKGEKRVFAKVVTFGEIKLAVYDLKKANKGNVYVNNLSFIYPRNYYIKTNDMEDYIMIPKDVNDYQPVLGLILKNYRDIYILIEQKKVTELQLIEWIKGYNRRSYF